MKNKKVVIIGAGVAGLTAAYELLKNDDYEIVIVEENNILGGISRTVNYKGNRMDIGGHRFFSKNKRVNDFWNSIMPNKLNSKSNKVILNRKRLSHIYYEKNFYDYPIKIDLKTIKNIGFLRTIESFFSYIRYKIIKRKENNLEDFYINRFGKKLYSMFFEKYTEKVWGKKPNEISADWGNQRVKGLSIIAIIKNIFFKEKKETSLIENFKYPKLGPGSLWEEVANKIKKKNGTILMNHKVYKINIEKNSIKSITCSNKKTIDGDIFISSMPIKDLINGISKVPKNIKNISNNLPYRDFLTLGLLVKKLKINDDDNWIYVQEPDVKLGRIQIFNNWSPYMVKDSKNTKWLGLEYFCNENDELWNMNEKEFAEFSINELVKIGVIDRDDVIDYHEEKIKKAYPAYFDSYKDIDKVINYLNKFDNLYCIGRNGQHKYNNMDHSMITAFEAVKNISFNIKDKANIWNVNTEKIYHEKKD